MRALILGGDGMLGHELLRLFERSHETRVTLRAEPPMYSAWSRFTPANTYFGVDLRYTQRLLDVLADFRPEVVINAAGVTSKAG